MIHRTPNTPFPIRAATRAAPHPENRSGRA